MVRAMDVGIIQRVSEMKKTLYFIVAILAVIMAGCAGGKKVADTQVIAEANRLVDEKQYEAAMAKYLTLTNRQTWDSLTYRRATIAASKTEKDSLACRWGRMFSSAGDSEKLSALYQSMKRIGRTEDMADLVVDNTETFKTIIGGDETNAIVARAYAVRGDKRLIELYPELTAAGVKAEVFDAYFKMAKTDLTESQARAKCQEILKAEPNQKTALAYLGKVTYEKAEKEYAKTMNEYNKNKSQAAYAYMARDLKRVVTPLYKESRDYFEKLRQLQPEDKNNLKYLINIYNRLENKTKAKELEKLLNSK